MQHSPVRSIIIWSSKDHLASGLIEVTYPTLISRKNITFLSHPPCGQISLYYRDFPILKNKNTKFCIDFAS